MERIIAHHQFNLVIEVPVCDTFITPGQESQISYMAHSQLLTPPRPQSHCECHFWGHFSKLIFPLVYARSYMYTSQRLTRVSCVQVYKRVGWNGIKSIMSDAIDKSQEFGFTRLVNPSPLTMMWRRQKFPNTSVDFQHNSPSNSWCKFWLIY